MNASDVAPIVQQAQRNAAARRSWCLIHPEQALELAQAVRERDEAHERLEEIRALVVEHILPEWAEHNREVERADLERIVELCKLGETRA